MKARKYSLVLAFVTAFLCGPVGGEVKSGPAEQEPVLIGSADEVLAGMKELYVVVMCRVGGAYDWKDLESKVEEKLEAAGIKIGGGIYLEGKFKCLDLPELRVCIDTIELEGRQGCVFHVQTALATKVFLEKESSWFRKAEVWQTHPVMGAVSAEGVPGQVEQAVLEQVEAFINARAVASSNAQVPQLSEATEGGAAGKEQAKPAANRAATKYEYVASKKSKVFHKSECRSVVQISRENLVGYSTRAEAMKGGKRPCKRCKP
ncbi:MAG: Ada metal-binding domain-containing protein [Planctomycetota bacterium]